MAPASPSKENARPTRAASPANRSGQKTASSEAKPDVQSPTEAKEKVVEEEREFGGTPGAIFIMLTSHLFMFGMASSLYGFEWRLFLPTRGSFVALLSYHFSQYVMARTMPGVLVPGQTGMGYWCNAYSSFYATLALAAGLHVTGVYDLTTIVLEYPAYLTTAMLLGNLYSVVIHWWYARGREIFSPYKFFMGIGVHPRFGLVDIKMVAETRVSWTLLFLIAVGAYIETQRRLQTWCNPAAIMVLAMGLYANACAKGEHFIPYTWDITTEAFGWMLCWWNLAGVPLLYCFQSLYIVQHARTGFVLPPIPPAVYYGGVVVALVLANWVWDEANYHKCYFKMEQRGEVLERRLFPTFRHVKDPKYIKCEAGVLLIDGWYKHARKIHYAADFCTAVLWGMSCGFGSPLPYVYCAFFGTMITHRTFRDEARCAKKYGATWDKYVKTVPHRFIPGVF